MSTPRKLGKELRELTERPTVLGTAISATLHGLSEEGLLGLIVAYANSDGADMPAGLVELLLRALGKIHIRGEPTDQQDEAITKASHELQIGRPDFRAAMTWLCSPKNSPPSESPSLKRLASGKVKWGRYPLIDKTSEAFVRYFENHGLKHFRSRLSLQDGRLLLHPRLDHLVDLFCASILNTCLARKPSEMAIKICPRCRKFFSSERKRFCSTECQWKTYWTLERRADDKWTKDLAELSRSCKANYGRSIEDLRKRLALPKVAKRLASIKQRAQKEDWAGWPKIINRIEAIEKLAAKSE
jgi:hypothetical protein